MASQPPPRPAKPANMRGDSVDGPPEVGADEDTAAGASELVDESHPIVNGDAGGQNGEVPASEQEATELAPIVRRDLRDMSPAVRKRWLRVLDRLSIVTLPRRIAARGYKIAGTPCDRCASMKLTESKFLIHEIGRHRRMERSKVSDPSHSNREDLGPEGLEFGPKEFRLDTLRDIHSRRDTCAVCRLMLDSLEDQLKKFMRISGKTEAGFYTLDVTCLVSWQVDGRILLRSKDGTIKGSRACTRRLRIRWEPRPDIERDWPGWRPWPESFAVLMEKKSTTQSLFLARSTKNFPTDAALVQRWLRFCDISHGDRCKPFAPAVPVSKPFFGVIDVKNRCLTKLPKGERYVALSYTWGARDLWSFKTTRKNIKYLMFHQGLYEEHDKLPRTIRDSIRLVTDLGERYLWVDALCIIQDSDRSWALNSRVMDEIYGNAYFTICAADGNDASAGLQALRGSHPGSYKENIAFYSPDVRLKLLRPAEHYIRESRWNTRGWTFQERILSPRCLIFADGRMFFQCRCTARSADIITEDDNAGWSVEFNHSPSLMLQKLAAQPLIVYKEALELYMKRKLTFQKDILAAFTGIGNLVCDALGGSLIYGLPSSHFDWALLWEFRDAAARREQEDSQQFPSWSWCGWKNEQMDFQYKETMLAGIEENLHDWLMNHTWITWYIRDANGNIRLVWNGKAGSTLSTQVETPWRGYIKFDAREDERYDDYGRFIKPQYRDLARDKDFSLILDECPFDVQIVQEIEALSPHRTERDMPFLQFYTWSAFFRIREDKRFSYGPGQNFRRYNIEDYKDDWCGTIMLDNVWVLKKDLELEDPLEFVAISDAKQFDPSEYDDWSSYIPVERRESTWDLYYVLLIEYQSDIAYRVGLGKIYKEAFENSCKREGKRWKEFILG